MNQMNEKKRRLLQYSIYVIAVLLLLTLVSHIEIRKLNRSYNKKLNGICLMIEKEYGENISMNDMMSILNSEENVEENIFARYGIDIEKDAVIYENQGLEKSFLLFQGSILVLAFCIVGIGIALDNRKKQRKIRKIISYVEQINGGNYKYDLQEKDAGDLSILESEIYKTTIMLREAAENLQKEKTVLKDSLSDISHQLKTPLTSLTINLENLEEHPEMDEGKRKKLMRYAKRDVLHMKQMVQMLLTLSRLDADVIPFEKKQTPIRELLDSAVDNVLALCDLKGVELVVEEGACENARLFCDPYWQVEAITNILKNGIEYANSKVSISYFCCDMYVEIVIKNDGPSISREEAKNIFKRFYRAQGAGSDSVGIGLALADAIVHKDGGYILVDSKEEEENGVSFILRYT